MGLPSNQIPILEEFTSIQGEGINIGKPYYFIRVAGCPLRCSFCDTERSWKANKSQLQSLDTVINRGIVACEQHGIRWMSITGGEPLLYPEQVLQMIDRFQHRGIDVHIETSGRFYNKEVHQACKLYSPDAKTPCTGEQMEGYFKGIENMRYYDQVKCLISTEEDFDYAHRLNQILAGRCTMVLQPFNREILTDSTLHMKKHEVNARNLEPIDNQTLVRRLSIGLRWLLETFKNRCSIGEVWHNVIITPQIHVMAFGNEANR